MLIIPFKCAYCKGNGEYRLPTFEENSKYSIKVTKEDLEFVKRKIEDRAKNSKNNICRDCEAIRWKNANARRII